MENNPQLRMNWVFSDEQICNIELPEGVNIDTFANRPNALNEWLDIVQYGLTNDVEDEAYYKLCMTDRDNYDDNLNFILVVDGSAAATITIICDIEKKEGYIHMVACKPEYRGRGLGTILNKIAMNTLLQQGMKTAYLTTDDWRIPAIKSYLRCGFTPDLSTDNFKERWEKIYAEIEK